MRRRLSNLQNTLQEADLQLEAIFQSQLIQLLDFTEFQFLRRELLREHLMEDLDHPSLADLMELDPMIKQECQLLHQLLLELKAETNE